MRPRVTGLVCLLLIAMSATSAVASVGWDNPLAVYITSPKGDYDIGSSVTVTVHVFKEGAYYDPDTVNLTVGATDRDVTLTKSSMGVYTAQVTIEQTDVDEWDDAMYLSAYVTDGFMGRDMAEAWGYVFLMRGGGYVGGFTVDINPGGPLFPKYGPGSTVDVLVEFRYEGMLVDPDEGTIDATLYDLEYDGTPMDLTRTETGVYEGSFTIPSGLRQSRSYEVEVSALYTVGTETYEEWDYLEVYVDLLTLWVHVVSSTPTESLLEMYVLDLETSTLPGARVVLNYTYWDESWDSVDKTVEVTTDENGLATLQLDYSDIDPEETYIEIEGYAEHDGLVQTYEYYIDLWNDNGGTPDPDPYEPLQVLLVTQQPLPPETTVDLQYKAYSFGVPLAGKDVQAYLVDFNSIIFHGTVRTDASGSFKLTVTTPTGMSMEDFESGFIEAEFQVQILSEWASYMDFYMVYDSSGLGELDFLIDPETTLTVEEFRFGGTVEATLDHADADGLDEQAFLLWGIGDPSSWTEGPFTGWEVLNEGSFGMSGFIGHADCTWSSGAYHANFVFPEFLPEDSKVFFLGIIILGDPDDVDVRGAFVKDIIPLPANLPPLATITAPVAGEQYSGILTATGTASDDALVERVEVRLDGGTWTQASGTDTWSFEINTTQLTSGTHMLEVRALDGRKMSPVVNVVFEVDQPPIVRITTPTTGLRVNNTFMVGGTAADDNSVDRVEYRVDSGTWDPATGTTTWTAEVHVAGLSSGEHKVEVRSSDGERTSVVAELSFTLDYRPGVSISTPVNASTQKKAFELRGMATDDVGVSRVEVRLDGGSWTELSGTTAWTWTVPVKELKEGEHTLEVRSWDGHSYSEVDNVTFTYKKPEESPGASAALALLALAGAVGAAHLAARGRRP